MGFKRIEQLVSLDFYEHLKPNLTFKTATLKSTDDISPHVYTSKRHTLETQFRSIVPGYDLLKCSRVATNANQLIPKAQPQKEEIIITFNQSKRLIHFRNAVI